MNPNERLQKQTSDLPLKPASHNWLKTIALMEGVKGLAAVAASIGLLSLAHHDLRALAFALIGHLHMDPDAHYPRLLLDEANWLQHADVRQVFFFACAYALLRFIEGYGLWTDRSWAEWLAAGSGTLYLPLELSHLFNRPSWINASVLILNVLIVLLVIGRLWQRKKMHEAKSSN